MNSIEEKLPNGEETHPIGRSIGALHLRPKLLEHLVTAVHRSRTISAGERWGAPHVQHHTGDIDEGGEQQHPVTPHEEGEQEDGEALHERARLA